MNDERILEIIEKQDKNYLLGFIKGIKEISELQKERIKYLENSISKKEERIIELEQERIPYTNEYVVKLEQENTELKNWKELHSSSALAEENIRIWKTVEELKKENEILDTKLGKYIEQKDEWVELMNKFKKQQNEFISWLESYIIELQNKDVFEYYKDGALAASKCISRKYKEIIKYE